MTSKSERFWDRMAKRGQKKGNKRDPDLAKMVNSVKKWLSPTDRVLDYGCGMGSLAREIAPLVKEAHGLDSSSGMIEAARKKAADKNLHNVTFAKSTILGKRYDPEYFNVILAFNILHLVNDPTAVVKRIRKLLKPGGLFISSTPCLGGKKAFFFRLLKPLSKIGIFPLFKTFTSAELEDSIREEGFTLVVSENVEQDSLSHFVIAKKV